MKKKIKKAYPTAAAGREERPQKSRTLGAKYFEIDALRGSGLESGDYESSNEVTRYHYNDGDSNMHKDCGKGVDFSLFCYRVSHNGQYKQAPDD